MPAIRVKTPYTVDATGNRESVSALGPSRWITVRQDVTETQVDYWISDAVTGGQRNRKLAGEPHTFLIASGLFQTGENAGYVEAVTGSFTMTQEEGL
jgi:hypothetical protein